jgi:hypothetical protein
VRVTKALTAVAAVAVLALAGCGNSSATTSPATPSSNGVSDLTADQILAKTGAAAKEQSSVHVAGKGSSGGTSLALDLKLRKGGGGVGTITLGTNPIQIITTGTDVYIKADKSFWASQGNGSAATVIGDRWVKASATTSSFASLAQLGDFSTAIDTFLKPDSAITKGDVGTASGIPAIALVSTSGKLWVATTGSPLPVQIDSGTAGDALKFTDWGATVDVPVPAEKDVLDLSKLSGK